MLGVSRASPAWSKVARCGAQLRLAVVMLAVDKCVDVASTATSHGGAVSALLPPPTTPPHNVRRGGRLHSSGLVVAGAKWLWSGKG